jgi:hypothetical protein
MAWIVKLLPTLRHPNPLAGALPRPHHPALRRHLPTKAEARSIQRAVEQGDHVACSDQLSPGHASMLSGGYVTTIWWPAWKPAHPRSAQGTRSRLTARILPASATSPWPNWTPTSLPPGSAT